MRTFAAGLLCLLLAGCAGDREDFYRVPPYSEGIGDYPCTRTEPNDGPVWKFDPVAPYVLEFGRGSGMCGLENTVVSTDGNARVTRFTIRNVYKDVTDRSGTVHRVLRPTNEKTPGDWTEAIGINDVTVGRDWGNKSFARQAVTRLSHRAVRRIADAIAAYGLPEMPRGYYADVSDGTQWVLWLRQNGRSKTVYFNNHFPASIRRFATVIDQELASASPAPWRPLTEAEFTASEKEIWNSIR